MGQRDGWFWRCVVGVLVTAGVSVCGCGGERGGAGGKRRPTVASLVPAAVNLIQGMGAGDHLVGIGTWDTEREGLRGLPRVGDYRTIDWEKIAELRPDVLVVQFRADKMPPGLRQRAEGMGIRLVNVRINHLEEVFATLAVLGEAMGEREKAGAAERKLRDQLEGVRRRVAGKAAVRTLMVRDTAMMEAVGGGNFLSEVLTVAGGVNAMPEGENSYPSIDRELLLSLNPDAVLQLLPEASAQVQEQARRNRATLPGINAVKGERVFMLTEWYILQPGYQVGDLAERFADCLHPRELKAKP